MYFKDVLYKLMKKTYGDIFHKPIIIKHKEDEIMKKIIVEINDFENKNSNQHLNYGTLPDQVVEPYKCKIKRFSYNIPYLYMKTSFQLISNVLSK